MSQGVPQGAAHRRLPVAGAGPSALCGSRVGQRRTAEWREERGSAPSPPLLPRARLCTVGRRCAHPGGRGGEAGGEGAGAREGGRVLKEGRRRRGGRREEGCAGEGEVRKEGITAEEVASWALEKGQGVPEDPGSRQEGQNGGARGAGSFDGRGVVHQWAMSSSRDLRPVDFVLRKPSEDVREPLVMHNSELGVGGSSGSSGPACASPRGPSSPARPSTKSVSRYCTVLYCTVQYNAVLSVCVVYSMLCTVQCYREHSGVVCRCIALGLYVYIFCTVCIQCTDGGGCGGHPAGSGVPQSAAEPPTIVTLKNSFEDEEVCHSCDETL